MDWNWTAEKIAYLRDAIAHSDYYPTLARHIAAQLPPRANVCDAGCGIGELSLALLPYCASVTAVDQSENATAYLRVRAPERGLIVRCGDIMTLPPETPYDAMVFCLFGTVEQALDIAAMQCAGKVFLIKRDYTHHTFSAGEISLGVHTASHTETVLTKRGIPYQIEHFSIEFGQPFRSLAAAKRFFELYNRDKEHPFTDAEIKEKLQCDFSPEFPYYLPHNKKLCLLSFDAKDIQRSKP